MTEQIQRKLSESKTARWSVLALVAFTMLCGYFITDMMAPLQDLLQTPVEGGGLGQPMNTVNSPVLTVGSMYFS